jgi:bacillithiol biosynthesis cysteine-adding enzyme BshC
MVWNALREYDSVSADPSTTTAPGSATRLAVDVRRFPWVRPLAGDYAFNFDHVAAMYAGDPRDPDAWQDAARRVRSHQRNGQRLVECLLAQQTGREAPAGSRDAARRLNDPQTVAIVTGQQAGAFGGPLFTILKAITALQLARQAESTVGGPAVAVFWVDAEDHDWNEIASCTVLDAQLQSQTITLAALEGAGELPIASLNLDARVGAAIDALEATLARTEFTDSVIASLRAAYRPGVGMADAFARWIESVLGPYGLVVFDASDPAVKPLLSDVFRRELASPGQTAALAARSGEAFAARGHSPQVVPQPDSVSLFSLDGTRKPIRRQGNEYAIGERTYTLTALADEAASSPHLFSPNVLLRPIVQDTLFPTICYVAGPSELAYLGQLRDVYEYFGVPMPLIHPRATATLVDSATARFLTKYNLSLEDLQPQDESALNRLLESQLPPTVESALKDAEDAIRRAMQRVIETVPTVDPTLAGAAKTTVGKMEHEVRALHGKVIQAAKRRDDTLRRQFTRAQAQTFQHGHPQERTLGVVYFLNLYGPALIDRLLESLPLDLGTHWVLAI